MNSQQPLAPNGLTLLELMVVISILILLALVSFPAVQSVREAARAAQCRNNLRQIGIALLSYHEHYGVFPAARAASYTIDGFEVSGKAYSPFARILPYLGESAVFNAINFEPDQVGYHQNETVFGIRIGVFLCPSDPHQLSTYARSPNALILEGLPGSTNYRVNLGGPYTARSKSQPDSGWGPFAAFRWVKASEISDGLSNTVMASEKIKGDGQISLFSKEGDFWYSGSYAVLGRLPEQSLIVEICGALRTALPEHYSFGGALWIRSGYYDTFYNHVVTPNSEVPDCAADGGLGSRTINGGVFAARSYHSGGVGALFGDGSVRFLGAEIELELWRALGTIAGGETARIDSY